MTEDARIQEIEDFLTHRMSDNDYNQFKQKIAADPSLAMEVELFRDIMEGISDQGRSELKGRLQQLENQILATEQTSYANAGTSSKSYRYLWWSGELAAVIILGLCLFAWLNRVPVNEQLFAQYYETYPNVVGSVERGVTEQNAKAEALQLYENGYYEQALSRLEALLKQEPQQPDLVFYAGLTSVQMQQLGKAESYLLRVIKQPAHPFIQQAKWYLSLVYVRQGEKEKALPYLQQLATRQEVYGEKARALLEALSN